jgi:hypothetical protein
MADTVVLLPDSFTVTIGGAEVTAQVSEATFAFDTQTATIKTLTGETDLATGEKCTLTLAAYSDWQLPAADSLCWTLWNGTPQRAQFSIVATDPDSGVVITATGTFQARRPPFGPTADDAAKFSLDMPVIGVPTIIPVTPPVNGGGARQAAA